MSDVLTLNGNVLINSGNALTINMPTTGGITQDENGYLVVSSQSSSGEAGLEYEEGVWIPSENISTDVWINFTNTHSTPPFFYVIWDATPEYDSTSNMNAGVAYYNFGHLGEPLHTSATGVRYGYAMYFMRAGTSGSVGILYPYTDTGNSSSSYSRYWAKETGIKAKVYYNGYSWQANHTFKWIAVWAPTT